jgi:hypothetical protein
MHPVVALVTVGVEMDVLGIDYSSFTDAGRNFLARLIDVSTISGVKAKD